jgi:PKD repeat protein
LIAYRTDAFMNFPDMERHIGTTPDSIWFYFEILPYDDEVNDPPYDVDAGEDGEIYVGDDRTFSGSAEDLDNSHDELTWTWRITEEGAETTLDGQTVTHTFDTVCIAEVTLTVSDPGGLSSSDSVTITVMELPEGGLGVVTGYVNDSAGEPIEGALVDVVGSALNEDTDALGFYSLSLAPGTYEVDASADGYANMTVDVTVEAELVSWLNFTLGGTSGSVTGHVYDSATETPVANALVQLFQPGDESPSYSKQTDGNGSFTIAVVDAGDYTAVVSKSGYETSDTTDLTVTPGQTVDLDISLTAIDDDGGSNTMVIAAAAAVIVALLATALLLKRRKGPGAPDDEPSSERTEEPGTPPSG